MSNEKERVKRQFGQVSSSYITSEIHAKGKDLEWLAEEILRHSEKPPLLALDIATGTGHTAFVLSRCAGRVIGLDLTPEMLEAARREADRRGLSNITWMLGDAEQVLLPDRLVDVITCRIAAHHFPKPTKAFAEMYRLLVPGGLFILIDNVAPDDPEVEAMLNQIERWRDPSHGHVYPLAEWKRLLEAGGFGKVELKRTWSHPVLLKDWLQRAKTPKSEAEQILRCFTAATPKQQQLLGYDPNGTSPQWLLKKAMWLAIKS